MVRVISSLNLWRTIFHTFPKSRGFIFPIHLQRVIRISCSPIATCQTPNTMPPPSPSHGTLSLHSLSLTQKVEKRFKKIPDTVFSSLVSSPAALFALNDRFPQGLKVTYWGCCYSTQFTLSKSKSPADSVFMFTFGNLQVDCSRLCWELGVGIWIMDPEHFGHYLKETDVCLPPSSVWGSLYIKVIIQSA